MRNEASQHWVTIAGNAVLVATDPEGRDIDHCPNRGPEGIKPCGKTLKVHPGYSTFIRIGTKAVCLDNLWGLTDGTPPGVVNPQGRPGVDPMTAKVCSVPRGRYTTVPGPTSVDLPSL